MSLAASRKWWAFRYSSTASKVLFFSSRCEAYLERRDLISFMLWVLASSTALFHCKKMTTSIQKPNYSIITFACSFFKYGICQIIIKVSAFKCNIYLNLAFSENLFWTKITFWLPVLKPSWKWLIAAYLTQSKAHQLDNMRHHCIFQTFRGWANGTVTRKQLKWQPVHFIVKTTVLTQQEPLEGREEVGTANDFSFWINTGSITAQI